MTSITTSSKGCCLNNPMLCWLYSTSFSTRKALWTNGTGWTSFPSFNQHCQRAEGNFLMKEPRYFVKSQLKMTLAGTTDCQLEWHRVQ